VKEAWEVLTRLPELLNQWGGYSYALLSALLVVGLALGVYGSLGLKKGRPANLRLLAVFIMVLAIGGFVLKALGGATQSRAEMAWLEKHQSRPGERRLVVANLFKLSGATAADTSADHEFASMLASLIGEDLPSSIPAPLVVPIDFNEPTSPWRWGIGQENYKDVLARLKSLQIIWGDLDPDKGIARAFLGMQPEPIVDAVVPLKELPVEGDPRRELQFGDGYYRLIGHVALAVAVQTTHDAEIATGDRRRKLFLLACQQLRDAQQLLVNGRGDPVLRRNLYDRGDQLIEHALAEAGVLR
jgi:hypothetical protein